MKDGIKTSVEDPRTIRNEAKDNLHIMDAAENEGAKKYIDEAEEELRRVFDELIYDHDDNEGQYQLNNLASGFNTLLKYARKWQESQEKGVTAAEALDALLKGKKIRRKTWDKGQYAVLNDEGDIVNHNGDCCYLPVIQCERASAICSAEQAEILQSQLTSGTWEVYDD